MTLETFLPYAPYLALVYVLFAFVQTARHRRPSFGALLIAVVASAAPIAAYLLTSDFAARLSLNTALAISAAIIFVASLVLRFYERRRHSAYGIIGLAVSLVLAVALLVLPAISPTTGDSANFAAANDNGNLINVAAVTPGAFSQNSDQAGFAPPDGTPDAAQFGSSSGFQPPAGFAAANQAQPTAAPTSTDVPTLTPSATIQRPTQIVFPTATLTPEVAATEAVEATAEGAVSPAGATCSLVIDYNLNLRDQPTTDGSTILLSIPYGSVVTTIERTADGWYSVTYDGQAGWVSGDYVTAGTGCDQLPTRSG